MQITVDISNYEDVVKAIDVLELVSDALANYTGEPEQAVPARTPAPAATPAPAPVAPVPTQAVPAPAAPAPVPVPKSELPAFIPPVAPKAPEPLPAPTAKPAQPDWTQPDAAFEELKSVVFPKLSGHREEVLEIFRKYGAQKVSDIPQDKYEEVKAQVAAL
jgi:hypothetical protein